MALPFPTDLAALEADASTEPAGDWIHHPGSPFQLFQPFHPPVTSRRRSPSWSRASATASASRRCSASPARARPSRWPTSSPARPAGDRHRAEQDAGGAAVQRVPRVLPEERGRVLRQLLRLLPARGLRAAARPVHREGQRDQRAHRADAPVGDQEPAGAARRGHRRDRSAPSTASASPRTTRDAA